MADVLIAGEMLHSEKESERVEAADYFKTLRRCEPC